MAKISGIDCMALLSIFEIKLQSLDTGLAALLHECVMGAFRC